MIEVPRRDDGESTSRASTVRVRGETDAVTAARARLLAIVAGQASAGVRLSEEHYAALKANARNLEVIRNTSGSTVSMLDGARCVSFVGSDAGVAHALVMMDQCLSIMLGGEYAIVPLPPALVFKLTDSGVARAAPRAAVEAVAAEPAGADDAAAAPAAPADSSTLLQSVADRSGATLWVRRNVPHATVCGPAPAVAAARALLEEAVAGEAALSASVPIEEWMVPAIIGQKGAAIIALSKRAGVKLDLDRERRTIELRGRTPAETAAAREVVAEAVAALARGNCVLVVGGAGIGIVIGKGGANVRRIEEETKATVKCDRDSGSVFIRGEEGAVGAAKAAIGELLMKEGGIDISKPLPPQATERVRVEAGQIAVVVGASGATIRGIEASTGARLNVDRVCGRGGGVLGGGGASHPRCAGQGLRCCDGGRSGRGGCGCGAPGRPREGGGGARDGARGSGCAPRGGGGGGAPRGGCGGGWSGRGERRGLWWWCAARACARARRVC